MSSLVTAELGTKDLINQYIVLPSRMKVRIDGHLYLNKRNQLGIWDKEKERLYCSHNRRLDRCKKCGGSGICEHGREKNKCKECGGSSICEHGKRKSRCKECGGSAICEHGREKYTCIECGGAGVCEHNRLKYTCKECGGSSICEHGNVKHRCKECDGSGICEHGKDKRLCKECGGSSICEHGKQKKTCKICDPMGHLINCVRSRTLSALKAQKASKNERTMEYVNCSVAHLYYHIEQQFEHGMNWDNMGKDDDGARTGWEIDHRRPCESFDFNDEEQKYMCFHWTNLQPLWGQENNEKSNKFDPKTFRYKWIDREIGWVGIPKYLMNE